MVRFLAAATPILVLGGALIVHWPMAGFVLTAGLWALVGIWILSPSVAVAVPFLTLLLIPADHIVPLSGTRMGYFVLAVTALLALSTLPRGTGGGVGRVDWDIYLLLGTLAFSTMINASFGELRGLLFWAASGLFLFWLRREESRSAILDHQLVASIAVAGSIGGAFALVGYLAGTDFAGLLPGYEPHTIEFSSEIGSRGSGLSGHPLRLGTLTMLSSLIAVVWLLDERSLGRDRLRASVALSLSLMGLVLSGARGAWLGLLLGLLAVGAVRPRAGGFRLSGKLLILSVGVVTAFLVSGLWEIIYERVFGSAVHVGSLAQRLEALQVIVMSWRSVPILGLGFGGAADIAGRAGLKLPNLENEYLRFFLAAGIAGPLALLAFAGRRLLANLRRAPSVEQRIAHGLIIALFANAATYNLFSWSIGPCLLVAVTYLALPQRG